MWRTKNTEKNSILVLIATVILSGAFVNSAQTSPLRSNGKIAFTSDRDGNREIYLVNPDGSNQTRLTNNTVVDDHPTWSPDGTKVAFLSQRPSNEFVLCVMNADGSNKTEITPVNYLPLWQWNGWDAWSMSWSPDGRQIVFSDGNVHASTLVIVNSDGTDRRNLMPGFEPSWSPDGSKILFLRIGTPTPQLNHQIYTARPDGSDLKNITPTLVQFFTVNGIAPVWSPDGLKIGFGSFDGANMVINIANADGSNPQDFVSTCAERSQLAPDGCSGTSMPSWSPNGMAIAFTNWGLRSGSQVYVKNVGDDAITRITNNPGINSNPHWQPLATIVTIGGRVTTPDGRGLRNATVTLTDSSDVRRTATTGSFGLYTIENVAPGQAYTIAVSSRRYRFSSRTVSVETSLTNVDFVGQE